MEMIELTERETILNINVYGYLNSDKVWDEIYSELECGDDEAPNNPIITIVGLNEDGTLKVKVEYETYEL